jgi:hypothetical protein
MSKFWQVNEDPMYDEDGVLVDEDYDEAQGERVFAKLVEELSPFETVNS